MKSKYNQNFKVNYIRIKSIQIMFQLKNITFKLMPLTKFNHVCWLLIQMALRDLDKLINQL